MNASVKRAGFLATLVGLSTVLGGCWFAQPLWEDSVFERWQVVALLLLVVLIILWVQYRKKQM